MNTKYVLIGLRPWLLASAVGLAVGAHAANTDIATAPLNTFGSSAALPNLMFVLDDSESMTSGIMPDWVGEPYCRTSGATGTDSGSFGQSCWSWWLLYRTSAFNGLYYSPEIRYLPPLRADQSSYPSQTSANTSGWTAVKDDAYNILSTATSNLATNYPDQEWCTTHAFTDCLRNDNYVLPATINGKVYDKVHNGAISSGNGFVATGAPDAPTAQARTFGPHYYKIIPGEYCIGDASGHSDLRRCQATPTATYNVPATLRWCDTDANARAATPAANSCQAARTESFKEARFPTKFFTPGGSATWYGSFARVDIVPGPTYSKGAKRSDCVAVAGACTYDEEMTNFANWWAYYHTRLQTMKTAVSRAFAPLSNQIRVGYMTINNSTGTDFLNPAKFESGAKTAWFSKLVSANNLLGTPLRSALSTVGQLYAGKLNTVNSVAATDPMQYSCQKNYTILSTDGYWNTNRMGTKVDGSTVVGEQDASLPRPYLDGTNTANTLSDVAAYYYNTDLRDPAQSNCTGSAGVDVCSNNAGPQRMTTYTLGMGAAGHMQFRDDYLSATTGDYFDVKNGTPANPAGGVCAWQSSGACNWPTPLVGEQTTIDDLWHAAVNGHGLYFNATDPDGVTDGLSGALNSITAAPGSAAAATSSNPNVSAGDNFVFASSYTTVAWSGELERRQINLIDGSISATSDWQAQALLDTNGARALYTFDPLNVSTHLKPFAWGNLTAAEQAYFQLPYMTAAGSLSQFCASGVGCLSSADQTAAAGQKVVDFLRGDRSNEGLVSQTTKYFRQRAHVLGDIVNSEAVYVQTPRYNYADAGYAAFKAAKATRAGRVYVGANDGMLHAFDAANGNEAWAYVPATLLPSLYKLADKDYGDRHQYFVDGSPVQADVYFGGAWHTLLVGGLGAGGRGYYALDVTDPAAPKALWEFTNTELGLAVGKPEVTKLKDGTWVVLVASGYNNNVAGGSGHGQLFVLNAANGNVIRSIDTGSGTAATPSGLAHIRAWVNSVTVDNTVQRVYAGDNLGNVWRFDVNNDVGAAGYDAQLLATLRGPTGNVQPVTARPELGAVSGNAVVYVGTGRYLGAGDLADAETQSIYAIKDKLGDIGYGNPRSNLNKFVQQTLTDITCTATTAPGFCAAGRTARTGTSNAVDLNSDDGWLVDLPANRERASTDPQLVLGTLVFTTNVLTPDACSPGSSYVNFFDYRTGAPISTTGGIISLGEAFLSSRPSVVCMAGGKCAVHIGQGDGHGVAKEKDPLDKLPGATRRTSWRELSTEN